MIQSAIPGGGPRDPATGLGFGGDGRTGIRLILLYTLVAAAMFAFDLLLPLGVAAGLPYVALVLLGLWSPVPTTIPVLAAIGTVLTVIGYAYSPEGGIHWMVLANRGLAIAAIWVAAFLAFRHSGVLGELRESEARLKTQFNNIPIPTFAWRSIGGDFELVDFNAAVVELAEGKVEGLIGARSNEFYLANPEIRQHMARALAEKSILNFESEYQLKSTGETRDFIFTAAFAPPDLVLLHAEDISERKHQEERLRQAQKMEAVGQLTGGVAHEFNNLLAVVIGNLELISEGGDDDKKFRRRVSNALLAADRGAGLTQRLLSFSRQQPLAPRSTDVNALIAGLRDLLRPVLGEGVEVETVLPAGAWLAMVDPAQLESTLLSLAVNARDAMPDGGRLTISTANVELDDGAPAVIEGEIAAGPYVMITVADTGQGMPEDVVERAYDPFFTTKEVGQGTGLGLSMVHGFIKQSGGHIEIASIPDGGTTITLYLPGAGEGPATSDEAQRIAPELLGHGETILVVEDDPAVRRIAVEMLGDLGYTSVEAENYDSALSVLDATPSVALLFTDVILPGGRNGFDIAREARQRRPDIKVLFATGYSEEAVARTAATSGGAGAIELIFKPYRKEELARRLAEQLDV